MFQNNKVNLVISILLAIVVWTYVFFEINPSQNRTISDVPVNFTGQSDLNDRGLTVSSNEEFTVDVTIRGPRSEIAVVNEDDIDARVDVSSLTEGENDIRVNVTVPDNVSRDDVKPANITIMVEEYISISKSVRARFTGDFEEDTEPGFVSWDPEATTISGARSLVEKVTHVEATVESNSVGDEEQTTSVSAVPVDENGDAVDGVSVSDKVIDVTSTLLYLNTVPLEVPIDGTVDSDYEVTAQKIPDSVSIKGIRSRIDEITTLRANSIDISDITESTEIPIEINLPDGVELAGESQNLVAIIEISGIMIRDLTYDGSDISFRNVENGYTVQVDTSNIKVSVYGRESDIADLKKSDIALYINMESADFAEKSYNGTIRFATQKSFNNVKISPARVTVTIIE